MNIAIYGKQSLWPVYEKGRLRNLLDRALGRVSVCLAHEEVAEDPHTTHQHGPA
jgi:hypothetical protein